MSKGPKMSIIKNARSWQYFRANITVNSRPRWFFLSRIIILSMIMTKGQNSAIHHKTVVMGGGMLGPFYTRPHNYCIHLRRTVYLSDLQPGGLTHYRGVGSFQGKHELRGKVGIIRGMCVFDLHSVYSFYNDVFSFKYNLHTIDMFVT